MQWEIRETMRGTYRTFASPFFYIGLFIYSLHFNRSGIIVTLVKLNLQCAQSISVLTHYASIETT